MTRAARLTLIGTAHREPEAEARLLSLLEQLRPDTLTLEMSPYALHFRQTRGPALTGRLERTLNRLAETGALPRENLTAHPAIRQIRELLALPFEYRAARRYGEQHGCRLLLIDSSLVSARMLRKVEGELLSTCNLAVLVNLPPAAHDGAREHLGLARRMLDDRTAAEVRRHFLAARRGDEGIGRRDARMADRIRRELGRGVHLVHLGGWVHLLADELGETLFSRLSDLRPRRVLLAPEKD